jgi:hypothetical protein
MNTKKEEAKVSDTCCLLFYAITSVRRSITPINLTITMVQRTITPINLTGLPINLTITMVRRTIIPINLTIT